MQLNFALYINRMIIPDIFGNHISGLDHGIPSKEKSVNGYSSFVGKYSFEWNGKSNKIWNGQANIANAIFLLNLLTI